MKNTLISRAVVTTVATGSAVLLAAGIASAHVSVVAPGAAQGGYSVLTFRRAHRIRHQLRPPS